MKQNNTKHKAHRIAGKKLPVDKNGCILDHLGNKFSSASSMCEAWKINKSTFVSKYFYTNNTLKEALETGRVDPKTVRGNAICVQGEYFPSKIAVSKHFGVSYSTIENCKDSLDDYIATSDKVVINGKIYNSYAHAAAAYKKDPMLVRMRLQGGMNIHDALTLPKTFTNAQTKESIDHLGNVWPSLTDMCNYYKIPSDTYLKRISRGWTKEKALTTPVNRHILRHRNINVY